MPRSKKTTGSLLAGVSQEAPRPPELKQGQGKEAMTRINPQMAITLDAGSFDWLWRYAEAKHAEAVHRYSETMPEYVDMVERTVESFRRAAAGAVEIIERTAPKVATTSKATSGRKIQRRVTDGDVRGTSGRRVRS